jgi:diguanylate cyclase (GGDEF)-like protein/PAS domain S-box-containing protein
MSEQSNLPAIRDRLSLVLESTHQIAFDWFIANDRLHFSGEIGGCKSLPIDTARIWRSSEFFALMHQDDRALFRMRLHEAIKGDANAEDALYRVELRLNDAINGWRWIEISGKVVARDRHGRALRMVGALSDIDERKEAEKKTARQQALHATLRQANHAMMRFTHRDALFREICRIVVEQGHFAKAWIGLVDTNARRFCPTAFYSDRRHDMRSADRWPDYFALSDAEKNSNDLLNNRSFICNDLHASPMPHELRAIAHRAAVQSLASIPFQHGGQPYGVLNLYAAEKHFFDTPSIKLLEQLAMDISLAITGFEHNAQREETERAIAESEQLKNAILTAALDCIISINRNGEIISFNQAAETTFGYGCNEVLGKKLTDIIAPSALHPRHRQELERLLTAGEATLLNRRIELTAMRADGCAFPIELAIVPVQTHDASIFTAFIRDISELKRSQAVLKESALRFRQLVELSPEAILVHRNHKFVLCNQAAVRMLGAADAGELIGKDAFDFIHPDHHAACRSRIQTLRAGLAVTPPREEIWLRMDGTAFDAEAAATRVIYDDEAAIQVVVRDITRRKRAEELQAGQNRILNMVATGIELPGILHEIALLIEAQTQDGLCSITLTAPNDATLSIAASPNLPDACKRELDGMDVSPTDGFCGAAAFHGELVSIADIARHPLRTAFRDAALASGLKACASWPIVGKSNKVLGTIALYFHDIREPSSRDMELLDIFTKLAAIAIESRESEDRIRYMAHYDGLTSLPNRFLFREFLDQALRNAQRNATKFAVFFIDLDKFKDINDTLGHDAGDIVLKEIAARLRGCVRHTDMIARMGGDEFYVLIEHLEDGHDAADVAQKLLEEAARPIPIGQHECTLSASIGIGIYPNDGGTAKMLLKNADRAMYRAKNQGKNGYCFFSDAATT